MKSIDTLVFDMEQVVLGKGGWNETINEYCKGLIGDTLTKRLAPSGEERKPSLRMSNIGAPCTRKLWYELNHGFKGGDLDAATSLKFLYGDVLEALLICLAKAAGHEVTGEQDGVKVDGIAGSRDCVIDGVTVDVKSASGYGFKKFENNALRFDDDYGYIRQLAGYVKGAENDPLVTDKKHGAFLAVNKETGKIVLDLYDLTGELQTMSKHIQQVKYDTSGDKPPARAFNPEAEGSSGNMALHSKCRYCGYKFECFPGLRAFQYSNKVTYLTKVAKLPNVSEITP